MKKFLPINSEKNFKKNLKKIFETKFSNQIFENFFSKKSISKKKHQKNILRRKDFQNKNIELKAEELFDFPF